MQTHANPCKPMQTHANPGKTRHAPMYVFRIILVCWAHSDGHMPLAMDALDAWRIPLAAVACPPPVPTACAPEHIEALLVTIGAPRPHMKHTFAIQVAGLRPRLDRLTVCRNIFEWSPRQGDGHYACLTEVILRSCAHQFILSTRPWFCVLR